MSETTITLEDLNYFWMPNGAPCFIADQDNFCEIVESLGFSIYYLFTNEQKIEKKTSTTYKSPAPGSPTVPTTQSYDIIHHTPKLFKVVSNLVGRSVSESTDPLPEHFAPLEEECLYNLPLIPYDIVQKLDEFFRLVHAKHGTESIVLLTFDQTKQGSDGWGVLVPEQTNTAAHCNYNAESVLEVKPEDAIIVGSVHSHPEMPAYASGTDHADQADFDGIHITYGWQKSVNNGATQYHLELQMSGKSFKMDVEDVFEGFNIKKDPDPEVVGWSEQVKKALPPHTAGVTQAQYTQANQNPPTTAGATTPGSRPKIQFYKENISSLGLDPEATVIAEIVIDSTGTGVCPSCEYELDDTDFYAGYCNICDIPIAIQSSSINQIASRIQQYRRDRALPLDAPAYIWGFDDNNSEFLINLNMDKALSNSFYDDDDIEIIPIQPKDYDDYPLEDNYDFDPDHLVCCGKSINSSEEKCICHTTIFYDDFKQFDYATADMTLYDSSSETACQSCLHYWTPQCGPLVDLISEYINSGYDSNVAKSFKQITECSDYLQYSSTSTEYLYENERYYY